MKETAEASTFHKFYIHSDAKVLVLVYELIRVLFRYFYSVLDTVTVS